MYVICLFLAVFLAVLSPTSWLVPAHFACHERIFLSNLWVVLIPLFINLAGPAALLYFVAKRTALRRFLTPLPGAGLTAMSAVPIAYVLTVILYAATAQYGFTTMVSLLCIPCLWVLIPIGFASLVRMIWKRRTLPVKPRDSGESNIWITHGEWLAFVPSLLGLLMLAAAPSGSFAVGAHILDSYEKRCPNLGAEFRRSVNPPPAVVR